MVTLNAGMLKKINAVLRPNWSSHAQESYRNTCMVRLVRSLSMMAVSERSCVELTLKRRTSVVSVHSGTALYTREDHVWYYLQNKECLHYLQELAEIRKYYTNSASHFNHEERKDVVCKKKSVKQPAQHNTQARLLCYLHFYQI